jgi:uncharacterized membrane protein YbhN (UPF0104 family)
MDDGMTGGPPGARRLHGFHWFSSQSHAAVRRRPTDVGLVVVSTLGLLLLALFAPGPTTVDEALTTVVQAVPSLDWAFTVGSVLATVWGVLLLLVTVVMPGRRVVAVYLLLAAGAAFLVAALAGAAAGTDWGESWAVLGEPGSSPTYAAVRLAVVTALVVTASPQVSRPVRRVGRLLLGVAAVSAVALGAAYPIGVLAGFLSGVVAGAAVHLVVGSPGGRPSPHRVAEALDDLGLSDAEVADLPAGASRVSRYSARVPGEPPLLVTVLGRDEWDAQAVASVWASLSRRGERLSLGMGRLDRVEHAAMASLLAQRAGVRVPPVVLAGRSEEGDAVLVTEALTANPLAELTPDNVSDALLDDAWTQLVTLHDARLAHGNVDSWGVVRDSAGRAAFPDLANARLGPDRSDVMTDRARLLVVCALAASPDRATASALRVLGPAGMTELLPFVQPAVLDRQTRSAVADRPWTVAELRAAAAAAIAVEPPPLEQVRRVTLRSLVRVGLIALVTFGLISAFSGIDLAAVWDEISAADWAFLVVALLVAPLAQAFFAVGTLGAATASLRFFPVLMLQYAVQFIALALPATAARVALDIRFFQSFGIAAGASVSIGVIDSVSGFVVQVLLLLVIVLSGLPGFEQPLGSSGSTGAESGDGSDPSMLALTLAIGLVSLLVVLVVPVLRRRFAERLGRMWSALREQVRNARGALGVLRHPRKVGQLIGGNLGGQLVQAAVLGICLAAFGEQASMSQLILINTGVSLFAGLMPVPGGVGVAEAGITAGLQAIGVPAPVAVSTAVTFRLVTFYLPPLWGSLAMRWLRRNSYV